MIVTKGLTKWFGGLCAVNDLNLRVQDGEIYGLLGPNGSGKSTTMKILTGILKPSSGTAIVDKVDVVASPIKAKKKIGYVPESPILYESLTPNDMFNFLGGLRNIPSEKLKRRVNYYSNAFEFYPYMHQYIGSLSFGNKQKVSIISALLHDPSILIMDEAMNGLDPKIARILREILFRFKVNGKSIIFSTHVLPLAEMVCDRIGIIDNGTIVAEGTVEELKDKVHEADIEDVFLELTKSRDRVANVLDALKQTE